MTFKRIYCIPTNRSITQAMESYVKEVDFAYKYFKEDFPFIIIETKNGVVEEENKNIISKISQKYPQINIIHLTMEKQEKLYTDLFKDNLLYLKRHYLTQNKDYGKAMNKIFLVAALFNVDIFHRRDSDTYLLNDYDTEYDKEYPIKIEIEYIGETISKVTNNSSLSEQERFTVVGSNYYGEWNMDIKDFARKDFNLVYRLYELLGFGNTVVKDICDNVFDFNAQIPNNPLHLSIIRSVNDDGNPDCGNMAMYKLFEKYPMLEARNTLASDYFVMDLATAMQKPSLHHNRPVFHEYTSKRFDFNRKVCYWEGVLKFCDYFNSYNNIYDGDIIDINTTNEELSEIIYNFSQVESKIREDKLNNILNEILYTFDENYKKVANELYERVPFIINELNDEYKLHAKMLLDWEEVINRCKKLNWRNYI